ncbi:unnamed protein product [Rotaria sordida]|uniref:Uncharacterized protein n=1 Tax=Rotaria sordida TaxID=392033 RepID=A0A815GRV2_9BILA|nr:unnamed protein product [Rotaria sordida]
MGCGSTKGTFDDEKNAVDNWRKKREQKRLKNINTNHTDNDQSILPLKIETIIKSEETKKSINEPVVAKPQRTFVSPPIKPIKPKSPSPPRIKGPAKIREIFIEKPGDIRGFGFKLDDGRIQNRPIFISTIEEGSPADKAGLCVDDEVVSMNNENIENMTFDQVRKILKERNLRGNIKMVVRTFEDVVDDQSQTIITGPTSNHSRTPSPKKVISTTTTAPSSSVTTSKTNIMPSSTTNIQSPVSTSLSYTPLPSDMTKTNSIPTSTLNIFAPKPFRSTNLDTTNNHESNIYDKELQDLEADFEKQLRGIDETQKRETTINNEKQETNMSKSPPPRVVVHTPQMIVNQSTPLSSVDSFTHQKSNIDSNTKQQRDESPIAQVRSYVEKQMDQLQQELEFGFPRTRKLPLSSSTSHLTTPAREQPVNIPIDLTNTSLSPSIQPVQPDFLRSSLKKSSSTQNYLDQIPSNRTYGLKINPNEHVIHYLEPYTQQKLPSNYIKHSIPDLSSMTTINRPTTEHIIDELKLTMPESYTTQTQIINQQQKKVTIQLGGKIPPQRITNKQLHATLNQAPRKTHFEDQAWINNDKKKQINIKSNTHRSVPLAPHHQELQMSRQPIYNYHDHHLRNEQQRNIDISSSNRQHRTKSPIRAMSDNNNDRVLSVSGKLRCSRCSNELGHGSAMVIESLGLYYHIECFCCCVCNIPLSTSFEGTDVRVRNNRLHCHNCFSDENEMLYQETYRLWQIHQKTNRSIRSLVAQSLYKNKPQLLALLSKVIQHRSLLQTIIDRCQLLEREKFLSNDLALILIYDQIFGPRVRGKFKGMLKRNQSSIDKCIETLLNEKNLSSISELIETTSKIKNSSNEIPRYVRINLLKTTPKKLRLNLKQLSFKKIKNV